MKEETGVAKLAGWILRHKHSAYTGKPDVVKLSIIDALETDIANQVFTHVLLEVAFEATEEELLSMKKAIFSEG